MLAQAHFILSEHPTAPHTRSYLLWVTQQLLPIFTEVELAILPPMLHVYEDYYDEGFGDYVEENHYRIGTAEYGIFLIEQWKSPSDTHIAPFTTVEFSLYQLPPDWSVVMVWQHYHAPPQNSRHLPEISATAPAELLQQMADFIKKL